MSWYKTLGGIYIVYSARVLVSRRVVIGTMGVWESVFSYDHFVAMVVAGPGTSGISREAAKNAFDSSKGGISGIGSVAGRRRGGNFSSVQGATRQQSRALQRRASFSSSGRFGRR